MSGPNTPEPCQIEYGYHTLPLPFGLYMNDTAPIKVTLGSWKAITYR